MVVDNVTSGSEVEVILGGLINFASGLAHMGAGIGQAGRAVYYNQSGFIGILSGGWLSGGVGIAAGASGSWYQRIGISLGHGRMLITPTNVVTSGIVPIGGLTGA